nr:MAG: hypothetical protein CM15mV30_0860 [uncultured marine virus]
MKTYIHVNQHKIRANKKHGTNEPVITVKRVKKTLTAMKSKFSSPSTVIAMINPFLCARVVIMTEEKLSVK